jgi:PAS domain S-box-containing protein
MEKKSPERMLKENNLSRATRVLVVDDDDALNTLFSKHLESQGFLVESAFTGAQAIAAISANSYHVMLLDYYLPDMDAKELVQTLAGLDKLLPFVIMTSFGDEQIAVEMMKLGAQDYFVKDPNLIEVLPAVLSKIVEEAERTVALEESEQRFHTLFERHNAVMLLIEPVSGAIIDANAAAVKFYGYSRDQLIRMNIAQINQLDPKEVEAARLEALNQERNYFIFPHRLANGVVRTVEVHSSPTEINGAPVLFSIVYDVTERKQAELELQHRNAELVRLYRVSGSLISSNLIDLESVSRTIVQVVLNDFGKSNCSLFIFDESSKEIRRMAVDGPYAAQVSKKKVSYIGQGLVSQAIRSGKLFNSPDVHSVRGYLSGWEAAQSELTIPLKIGMRVIGVIDVQSAEPNAFNIDDERLMTIFAEKAALVLEHARLYEAEKLRVTRLAALASLSTELATMHSQKEVLDTIVARTAMLADCPACSILLLDDETKNITLAAQSGLPDSIHMGQRIPLALEPLQEALNKGSRLIIPDIDLDAPELRAMVVHPEVRAFYAYPMIQDGRVRGCISMTCLTPRTPTDEENSTYELLAKLATVALDNARLFEETTRHLARLTSLRTIDMAINSSLEIEFPLRVLLDQAILQLNITAADILLYNPKTLTLRYLCGRGLRLREANPVTFRLGESYAGRAVLERSTIHIPNLMDELGGMRSSPDLVNDGYVALVCKPLIAKGEIKGVLEVFHRKPLYPEQEWFDFLETIANQAAITIDNLELFENLQRSNVELSIAYDATIEGWSRTLDLRDRETEGHSQRVADNTVDLARAMGVRDAELIHVRRGALLHDMGKMGIPDTILLKPGPLTDDEWVVMRKHPGIAYKMLSPIAFLRPALDIPYCHHEKWDGTGYPRGLAGEQIPLAARIFAVVDVWDALRSDRPYRPAWSEEETFEHIRQAAGNHFDPKVVEAFFVMLGKE